MKSIRELIELSLIASKSTDYETDGGFDLTIEGLTFTPHTASVSHKDILFYFDGGCATAVVDLCGDEHSIEILDWELDMDFFK